MTTKKNDLVSAGESLRSHLVPGASVLCAVSGGLDSMCLLHFLRTFGEAELGLRVTAAHFNHRLRGENSDRDEAFVRTYCRERGIPFVSGGGDTRGRAAREHETIEEAGRALRYAFLRQAAEERGCCRIATAHHADDSAETMLLNLIRGTGLRGLAGIPESRDGIIRPFLGITRAELSRYAGKFGIPHVEDESNAEDAAARNTLRHRVLPVFRELNPRAVEHMARTAELLRAVDGELDAAADRSLRRASVRPDRVSLQDLPEVPEIVRPRVLLGLFDLLGTGRKDVTAAHLEAMDRLWGSHEKDARISLPHGVTARAAEGCLILERAPGPLPEVRLTPGVPVTWGEWILTLLPRPEGEGMALKSGRTDAGDGDIVVAPVRPGARLTLSGFNGGGRTVKRLCLDRKIALARRDRLPSFYVGNRLAAVWPLGVDQAFLPEGESCRFIQINRKTEENDHAQ
jgi:tRNA(Ile)-lysidine synthase